ncbi:MAG TPA: hypothetical protein VKC89_02490 [Patescibacteria group bacterium]|nr:hypothetical protein [Patescibacteria group bacterium]
MFLETTARVAVSEAEWERQAKRFVELGFHKELGLSEKDYLASVPRLTFLQDLSQKFDFTVLVETRIPVERQCELAGIEYALDSSKVGDWPDKKYTKPTAAYVAQLNDGRKTPGHSLDRVTAELEGKRKDERKATALEGLSLVIAHPGILDNVDLILPGSSYATYDVVKLHKDKDTGKIVMTSNFFAFKGSDPCGIVTSAR